MRPKYVRAGAMVLALLMIVPLGIQIAEGQYSGPSIIVEFLQLVDDSTFESPPNFAINGSSDEFSTSHHISEGGDDYNRAILNWTHTANTPLDFRPAPDSNYPECNDFGYLFEDLTWDYEVEPEKVRVKIELRVNFTGEFAPSVNPEGEEMSKVHIWFIDSSGDWCMIDSFTVFHSSLYEKWIYVSEFEVANIFRGMIKNSAGIQDDPSDDFSICVGLSPSDSFRNYSSTEPWRTYNGSVILELSKLEFHVAADVIHTVTDQLPTIANQTWGTPHSEFIPYFAMGDDGAVYGVVTTSNYDEGILQLSLVKWDQAANIAWNVTWNETRYAMGSGISTQGDYIYTTGRESDTRERGTKNLIIVKWDSNGNKIWKRVIDTGWEESGFDIEVASDESIYIIGHRDLYIEATQEYRDDGFFLKYDATGNLLWNTTADKWMVDNCPIYLHPNGTPYTIGFPEDGLYRWTNDGTPLLVDDGYALKHITFSSSGVLYLSRSDSVNFWVEKINSTGHLEELLRYEYYLQEPWYDWIEAGPITTTSDSIYVILKHLHLNYYYELYKFDLTGNKIWNKTILDLHWRGLFASIRGFFMEFAPNDLLYICSPIVTAAGGMDLGLAILNPENAPYPPSIPSSTSEDNSIFDNLLIFLLLVVGGVGAVVVIVIYFKKLKG